jgi:hypothetical protein
MLSRGYWWFVYGMEKVDSNGNMKCNGDELNGNKLEIKSGGKKKKKQSKK